MSVIDQYISQVRKYNKAGSIGQGLLDARPDMSLGKQGLLDIMNEAEGKYLSRISDPASFYEKNPEAQGLIGVHPEEYIVDLVGGIAPKGAMLVGAKAMGAKSMMLDMANKMKRAGKTPLDIKKSTNITYDRAGNPYFEIPDAPAKMTSVKDIDDRIFIGDFNGETYPYTSLGNVMEHDELYKIFPDLADLDVIADPKITGKNAAYSPDIDAIKVSPDMLRTGDRDDLKEIILHEANHAIARRIGTPAGASSRNVVGQVKDAAYDEGKPYAKGLLEFERAAKVRQNIGTANYVNNLDNLSKKQNIRESDIRNLSDWYEYNDDIRATIGSMPKSGEAKKEWLRGAAAWLKNRNESALSYEEMVALRQIQQGDKAISAQYRKAGRELDKYSDDARKAREISQRYDRLTEQAENLFHGIDDISGAHKVYLSELGEQSARMTQGRRNLPYSEMRTTLPEKYDPFGHLMSDDYWMNMPKGRYGHEVDEYLKGLLHKID